MFHPFDYACRCSRTLLPFLPHLLRHACISCTKNSSVALPLKSRAKNSSPVLQNYFLAPNFFPPLPANFSHRCASLSRHNWRVGIYISFHRSTIFVEAWCLWRVAPLSMDSGSALLYWLIRTESPSVCYVAKRSQC